MNKTTIPSSDHMDLEALKEQFGEELANKIDEKIAFCQKENLDFKVEVVKESQFLTTIAFATAGFAHIFLITTEHKYIISDDSIGYMDCRKALELMDSF